MAKFHIFQSICLVFVSIFLSSLGKTYLVPDPCCPTTPPQKQTWSPCALFSSGYWSLHSFRWSPHVLSQLAGCSLCLTRWDFLSPPLLLHPRPPLAVLWCGPRHVLGRTPQPLLCTAWGRASSLWWWAWSLTWEQRESSVRSLMCM